MALATDPRFSRAVAETECPTDADRMRATDETERRYRGMTALLLCLAVLLGALQAWDARHAMNPDGVSYLDMADAYLRGDWHMAVNAHWSPLYSWLLGLAMLVLKPSPYWQFASAHLVNFAVYLWALGCFHFLLAGLMRHVRRHAEDGTVGLPQWAWLVLGYCLFAWSSLTLITVKAVTPDLCVAGFAYLITGLLLRIRTGSAGWGTFVGLGAALGLGYLAKAVLFPLAFIFLAVGFFAVGNLRKAVPRLLAAFVVFLAVGSPFIIALSKAKGRPTFGESGKLAYAWFVNGVVEGTTPILYWQDRCPEAGTPRHPARRIFDDPAAYEFGNPIGGTYPMWYDPGYWYEGVESRFDLRGHAKCLMASARTYSDIFFSHQFPLIVGVLVLYLMGARGWRCVRDLAASWPVLVPALAALGMYSLVYVEGRYVGGFVALFWLSVLSGVRLPDSDASRRVASRVSAAVAIVAAGYVGMLGAKSVWHLARDWGKWRDGSDHLHWQIADDLHRSGIRRGDKVASIGWTFSAYWARLAGVRIVAEIPLEGAGRFWEASDSVQAEAIKALTDTGAKVIVAQKVGGRTPVTAWRRIGRTSYYVYGSGG